MKGKTESDTLSNPADGIKAAKYFIESLQTSQNKTKRKSWPLVSVSKHGDSPK